MGVDDACIVNVNYGAAFIRRLGHIQEMAKRLRTGNRWGEEIGPYITIL